jgi:hypothetical protein
MVLKKGPLTANVEVYIRYMFTLVEHGTFVNRQLDLRIHIPGLLKVAEPLILLAFRKENVRTLAALKRFVEAHPQDDIGRSGAS